MSAFATTAPSATRWTDGASVPLASQAPAVSLSVLRDSLARTVLRLATAPQTTTSATPSMAACALSPTKDQTALSQFRRPQLQGIRIALASLRSYLPGSLDLFLCSFLSR